MIARAEERPSRLAPARAIRIPPDRITPVAIVAIVLVAAAVYANSVFNQFVLDDRWVILDNPLVHSVSGFWRAWVEPYWPPQHPAGQYRPLALVSFTADWLLSGGDPRWFHAMNVVWHAAASLIVWVLLRRLLSPAGALAAGLLFAVHPVHVEAVANIVGRAEAMATAFGVAAVLAHARRSWAAPLLFALALASKESAIVVIALAGAWDLVVERAPRAALRDRRWLYAGYAGVIAAYAAVLAALFARRQFVDIAALWNGASAADRWLTMLSVIPHYVRLMVAPAELSADYNPRVITLATGLTPLVLSGLLLLATFVAAAWTAWRRSRRVLFALAWFAIALAPVSNVLFPSGVVLAERTLYLPSVAACLLAGIGFEWLAMRRTVTALVLAGAAFVLMAVRTWTRTPVWRTNRTLLLVTAADHPESYKIHQRAAGIFMNVKDTVAANREYAMATRLFDRDPYLYREVAEAALQQGDYRRAIAMLDSSLRIMPDHPSPWLRLADARFMLGDWSGAITAARRGYELAPDSIRAVLIIASSARSAGDAAAAAAAYRAAIDRHPRAWELHTSFAALLLDMGDTASARRQAAEGVRLSRNAPEALQVWSRVQGSGFRVQ